MTRYEDLMDRAEESLEKARKSDGDARSFLISEAEYFKRCALKLTMEQAAEIVR